MFERLRRRARDDDGGFALIFVLMVTTVIAAAVGTTMFVAAPNVIGAKRSQDSAAALLAAQSGVDDAVAYLTSIPSCRSQTRICPQALGASSSALASTKYQRPSLGTGQSFAWSTASSVTADGYVRVTSTGTAGNASKRVVADLSLKPSILGFGYYTDYESQSPAFLYRYFGQRTIALSDAATYAKINANDTNDHPISVSDKTTVTWQGPPRNGTNPYPAQICGQHWYYESPTSPGRYNYGDTAQWGESGTINGRSLIRTSSCDVIFTTGMTEDGPIYSRDALLISDGTSGGTGPIFKAPVYSLWGYHGYDTPRPPAQPWRMDANVGGRISTSSPYSPAIATSDLSLPPSVGEDGVADDACIYHGPTRVKLNGDGTATITSPATTAVDPQADRRCYPSSLVGGIVGFTLNYKAIGSGTIRVENGGTAPSAGWPANPTKSTQSPAPSNEVFYLPSTSGGAAKPDKLDTSAATDTCNSSQLYAATSLAVCAWSRIATATDGGYGWASYSPQLCSAATADNRELFECEYTGSSLTAKLNVLLSGGAYATLRARVQADLAANPCVTGSVATQQTCLTNLVNADLQRANTGGHPAGYTTPARNDHRYVVVDASAGTAGTGAATSVGTTGTNPTAGDSLFTYSGSAAQEAAVNTPITLKIARQTWNGSSWTANTVVPQFAFTVTNSDWSLTAQAGGASYFPDPHDVTDYNTGTTAAGSVSGSTGVNQPGDIYVEGTNAGKLSLIAQNDVVVTGDITDASADTSSDAVDITADGDVRNYHPVQCTDQTAADIDATSAGWCPNDLTGLTASSLQTDGQMNPQHPAEQYQNMRAAGTRRIDAAIFALSGSFGTDNYNRGEAIGDLNVNGGVYQSHRGANGTLWAGGTKRPRSGYLLNYHYVDLQRANLPYAPPATGGNNVRVWNVVSLSAGTP